MDFWRVVRIFLRMNLAYDSVVDGEIVIFRDWKKKRTNVVIPERIVDSDCSIMVKNFFCIIRDDPSVIIYRSKLSIQVLIHSRSVAWRSRS